MSFRVEKDNTLDVGIVGDLTADDLNVTGDLTTTDLNVTGSLNITGTTVPTASLTNANGALPLDVTYNTIDSTTGALALTLADGVEGQQKIIAMTVDGGDATLTPANLTGGTTITFNDVGDAVQLLFVGGSWTILSNAGATVA